MLKNKKILKFAFLFLIGLSGSVGLLACGGNNADDVNNSEATNNTTQTDNMTESDKMAEDTNKESDEKGVVEIEGLDSLRFTVTEITAKPGEKITVKLLNNSSFPANVMSHNFVLLKKSTDPAAFNEAVFGESQQGSIPESMTDQVIADTGLVAGGESKSVTFRVPNEPGDYIYICTFPGHFSAGMKGTLTVN